MRKEIILLSVLLLALPSLVHGLYGGETVSYNFSKCQSIEVNISNSSFGEWSVSPDCTEQSAGNFYCNCSDNWTLFLSPASNAVGTYQFAIRNYFTPQTPTTTQTVVIGNTWVIYKNRTTTNTVTIPSISTITVTNTATTTITIPAKISWLDRLGSVLLGLLAALGIVFLILLFANIFPRK